MLDKKFGV